MLQKIKQELILPQVNILSHRIEKGLGVERRPNGDPALSYQLWNPDFPEVLLPFWTLDTMNDAWNGYTPRRYTREKATSMTLCFRCKEALTDNVFQCHEQFQQNDTAYAVLTWWAQDLNPHGWGEKRTY